MSLDLLQDFIIVITLLALYYIDLYTFQSVLHVHRLRKTALFDCSRLHMYGTTN